MPISPGGTPLAEAAVCFHCQQELVESAFQVTFHTVTDDVSLSLCEGCQGLRREGQLPVELLLQQWLYSMGQRDAVDEPFRDLHVSLACLGCGSLLGALTTVAAGVAPLMLSESRRLPDGSTVVPCPQCRKTNVLESRSGQLIAVKLWVADPKPSIPDRGSMQEKESTSSDANRPGMTPERERTPYGSIEFRPHTADLIVELRGHSAEDLFRLASWALARVQVIEWPVEATLTESVELESDGWDDLLVNWINQLIFLSEKQRALWTAVSFSRLHESGLTAQVSGPPLPERPDVLGREVKAASYFGLELIPGPSLWLARVTLDL